MNNVDYIVVGLGLAGLAFVEKLIENNKTFVVFEDNSQTSSLVAGGMYNPVILKRFTPAWNAHEQMHVAIPFYKRLEEKLQEQFDVALVGKKVFKSVEDENNWFEALDKPNLSCYMESVIDRSIIPSVKAERGFGTVKNIGRIQTKKILTAYKNYLKSRNNIILEKFDYNLIEWRNDEKIKYKEITTNRIVFSEGFGVKENPYFNYLPLNGTKGELITIYAPNLKIDFLLKSSVFVLPLGNDYYKVGATFNWTDKTLDITEEGRKELKDKLEKTINTSYEIIDQTTGIRPTVKDRRPLVGIHPKYKELAILNGLGTRGVLIAPTIAESLYNHLENEKPLSQEINIDRFRY